MVFGVDTQHVVEINSQRYTATLLAHREVVHDPGFSPELGEVEKRKLVGPGGPISATMTEAPLSVPQE